MFFTAVGICKFAALVKIVFYMEWMYNLFFGGGIGHSILLVATVIFMGILLGKIKIAGISLGITWILFVGIFFSHFNMRMDPEALVIEAFCQVKTEGRTGVEMEALTGVSTALLTVYDMCKAIDKRMVIEDIHLCEKTGGKSGEFRF